jgi:hypothetical protein
MATTPVDEANAKQQAAKTTFSLLKTKIAEKSKDGQLRTNLKLGEGDTILNYYVLDSIDHNKTNNLNPLVELTSVKFQYLDQSRLPQADFVVSDN